MYQRALAELIGRTKRYIHPKLSRVMADSGLRLDKSTFSVTSFTEAQEQDRSYWLSLRPQERLVALEQMRQINYGYHPASDRVQRTIEVGRRT